MALASLLFAGACALGFVLLMLAPRWVQVVVTGAGIMLGGFMMGGGVIQLDGNGLLAGLLLVGFFYGLDVVLRDLRRPSHDAGRGG